MAYLIRERGVSPFAILAITFTNKAAREMADRVEGLLGTRIAKGMWSYDLPCGPGVRMLRREHEHVGIPSRFSIYDEGDTERVLSLVIQGMDLDPKRYPPRAIAATIGRAKDNLFTPTDFQREARTFFEKTVADVYAEYQRRLASAGALDFDDIIMEPSGCSGSTPRSSGTTRSGSSTSSSTSTRTPTGPSTTW